MKCPILWDIIMSVSGLWWLPPPSDILVPCRGDHRLARAIAVAYTLYHDFKIGKRPMIDHAVDNCNFNPILQAATCTARVLVKEFGLKGHAL